MKYTNKILAKSFEAFLGSVGQNPRGIFQSEPDLIKALEVYAGSTVNKLDISLDAKDKKVVVEAVVSASLMGFMLREEVARVKGGK